MAWKNWVVLDVAGPACFLVEEYSQAFSGLAGHYTHEYLDQETIVLGVDLCVLDVDPGVSASHTLYLSQYALYGLLRLIFKHITPDHCAILGLAGQGTLLYVESIGEVAFDQLKIHQGEFLVLIYSIESNECGHVNIYRGLYAYQRLIVGDAFLEIYDEIYHDLEQPEH